MVVEKNMVQMVTDGRLEHVIQKRVPKNDREWIDRVHVYVHPDDAKPGKNVHFGTAAKQLAEQKVHDRSTGRFEDQVGPVSVKGGEDAQFFAYLVMALVNGPPSTVHQGMQESHPGIIFEQGDGVELEQNVRNGFGRVCVIEIHVKVTSVRQAGRKGKEEYILLGDKVKISE